MNITEANATNTVLRWVTGLPSPSGPITFEEAKEAAAYLADRAHKALSAGLRGTELAEHWPVDERAPASLPETSEEPAARSSPAPLGRRPPSDRGQVDRAHVE